MTDVNYALSALGATATANNPVSGHGAALSIDGSDATYAGSSGGTVSRPYIRVDLGSPQFITSVSALMSNALGLERHSLQASTDDVNWDTIADEYDPVDGVNTHQTGGVTYRYWRLYGYSVGSTHKLYVYTLSVLGPSEAPPNPTVPLCDEITAWLDALDANFVPCVEDWLEANP